MKPQGFVDYCKEECSLLVKDRWLFAVVSWLPVVLFILLWSLFSDGVCRNLPVAIIDYDQTSLSRQFIRSYDASPTIALQSYIDEQEALTDLRTGKVYGVVLIPAGLEEDTTKRLQPKITAFINYQYLLVGKQVNSALQKAHSTTTVRLDIGRNLVSGQPVFQAALAGAMPIAVQFTPLGNNNADYGQFLVTAMIPAAWQILIVMATVMSFGASHRCIGIETWLQRNMVKKIAAKLLPLTLVFWLQGILFLWAMFGVIGWPMHGSWVILAVALLLTILGCQAAAGLFFLLTCDTTRAMSLSAAYTAPGLAYMGITFPVSDMSLLAKVWRSLLPVSNYIEIQVVVANYGATLAQIERPLTSLVSFGLLFILVYCLAHFRTKSPKVSKGAPA